MTPWMAKDQADLLKQIKTKPLQFPQHIHRSDKVKDLLRGMLKVNEQDRMSWDDVFNHPLLQDPKPEPIVSIDSTQATEQDLELQKMNDIYLANNRYVGYLDNNVEKVPEVKDDDKLTPSELVDPQ